MAKRTKKMTEEEFVEAYSCAPWDMDEVAELAVKVDGELGTRAKAYMEAKARLDDYLEEIGYEWG